MISQLMKLKTLFRISCSSLLIYCLAACSDGNEPSDPKTDPDNNGQNENVELKPRYIWIDASANFPDFANDIAKIRRDLTLAKQTGFTDIVVDIRPMTGDILYNSPRCEQVPSLNAWVNNVKTTIKRTATWDYLQTFIDEGHALGLTVHAGFNTMIGGHASGGNANSPAGLLYRDSSKKEWATYRYNNGNPCNIMDLPDQEKFLNPGHPEVQQYLCDLLADLAKYNIDGIVLDRGRYNDLFTDFSPLSRQQFEEYIGYKLENFPGDILPPGTNEVYLPAEVSTLTQKWLEYRAKTIYDFMVKARNAVKSVNPDIKFGVYVGGWYNSYYNTGANWSSQGYDHSTKAKWCSPDYRKYAYADLMDHMLIGAYATPDAVSGNTEWTMEGFCFQAKNKIGKACPLVVGGPDVDWRWTGSAAKYSQIEILSAIRQSVTLCINACDGYFLFDMIHLKMDPEKWDAARDGINSYILNASKNRH